MAMQQQWPQEMHVRAHAVAMAAVQAQFSPQGTSLALQDSLSAGQPGETRVTGMPAYLQAPGEGQGPRPPAWSSLLCVLKASATGPRCRHIFGSCRPKPHDPKPGLPLALLLH